MSTITTRAGKGSALTHNELDANFKKVAQVKVANYTVAESDNRDTIQCSGTFTVTLPDATAVVAAADSGDFEVFIKNIGTGTITVARTTGTDTIDGTAANITILAKQSVLLKVDQAGTGYNILGGTNNLLGLTSTVTELNYNDITTLGTVQASKTVTANANGNINFDTSAAAHEIAWNNGTYKVVMVQQTSGVFGAYDTASADYIYSFDPSSLVLTIPRAITASGGITGDVTGNVTGNISGTTGDFTGAVTAASINLGETTLDHYQQGTWTPTIQDSSFSDAEGQIYTTQDGKYTRIGNVVYVTFQIITTSLGTLTGADPAYIAGLPFTSTTGLPGGIVLSSSSSMSITATASVTGTVVASNTIIQLNNWDAANGTSLTTITEVSDTTNITGHGFYFV